MKRPVMVDRLGARRDPWDIVVIGGGATGVGIALDAAARGYDVALFERGDFGKGTSTRSTKLIHGGVRYLQQGNVALVMEALKERGILRRNAPHHVHDLAFVVPNYDWWETPFYGIGMKVYDALAGRWGFGRSKILSVDETVGHIPTIEREGLRGGVLYYDGQFDDARLLIDLAATAIEQGAILVNYAPVVDIIRDPSGFVGGVVVRDDESGATLEVHARVVINATGPFTDGVRRMVDPEASSLIVPSQGAHIVLPARFLPGDAAIMVPRTSDGRVLFAIPWHGHALVGTTDVPIDSIPVEPRAFDQEIEFLLETAAEYLTADPTRADVCSAFAGIRPLARTDDAKGTAALSREHVIHIDGSGMLTIAGGKWTTYRRMAEDAVDHAATLAHLDDRPCVTRDLRIHGHHEDAESFGDLARFGADAPAVADVIAGTEDGDVLVHPDLPYRIGEVVWSIRHEMARTVEDCLARRTRALLLNARASIECAPRIARLLAQELDQDDAWERAQVDAYTDVAQGYVLATRSG